VIAPATANVIGKIAGGIADDLLTTVVMATKAPVLLAPAMNVHMWENPICQENIRKLSARAYHFIEPEAGELALRVRRKGAAAGNLGHRGGDPGPALPQDLRGKRCSSPPARRKSLSTPSAFSATAPPQDGLCRGPGSPTSGGKVILVGGPTALAAPSGVKFIAVRTAVQMRGSRPGKPSGGFGSGHGRGRLRLPAQRDFLGKDQEVRSAADSLSGAQSGHPLGGRPAEGPTVNGRFCRRNREPPGERPAKAGREEPRPDRGQRCQSPRAGFAVETNIVKVIDRSGKVEELPLMGKEELANRILDRILFLRSS